MFSVFELFVLVLWCHAFVFIVLSDESRQNQGRGLVDRGLVGASGSFVAGRLGAALLFRFFIIVLLSICLWYASIVAACKAQTACLVVNAIKVNSFVYLRVFNCMMVHRASD